ncbi:Short chain dehydrogenase yanD [Colletotrichum sidae]|uniref:Short chain dehydrogenase yanD n=3 Tax=Colletotrichum orbiculare species complex TaxID=2707354 RepID=A0A4R8RLM4_COLTR|nr:Short chain dehydrogenase yanD [Colletotrichum spinosum]TDZ67933.1 Short chain dehydrogenase yanD [Colletotrichum trifolii]TEA15495.1 Short chain dehydrogenase yanD [Colletotrichum sidae]
MSDELADQAGWEANPLSFVYRQAMITPAEIPVEFDLSDCTLIMTGASSGLGLEASRQFLERQLGRLVMGVRNTGKGDALAEGLRREFPLAHVSVWHLEMESYESVRAFAARCRRELPRIDMVILNAGVVATDFQRSREGHELMLQVNYLSTALQALLLLPIIKAKRPPGEPGRLVIVSSDMTYWAEPEEDMVTGSLLKPADKERLWESGKNYQLSKFLGQLFVAKLAAFVDPESVVVNLASSGLTAGTNIVKPAREPFFMGLLKKTLGRSIEVGARSYLDAAIVKGPESHGSFTSDGVIKPWPAVMYTSEGRGLRERIWAETKKEPGFAEAFEAIEKGI